MSCSSFTKEDGVTTREQEQVIEKLKDLTAGLMNGSNHSATISGQVPQCGHHKECRGTTPPSPQTPCLKPPWANKQSNKQPQERRAKLLQAFYFLLLQISFFQNTTTVFSISSPQRSSRTCRGRWWVRPRRACEDEWESQGQCSLFASRLHLNLADASCRWACRHSLGDPCRSWFCRRWPSSPPATFRLVTADLQSSTPSLAPSKFQSSHPLVSRMPANIPSRIIIISLQQQQQPRSSLTRIILLRASLEKINAGNGELLFFLQLHHRRGLSSSHSRESRLWEWHSSPICLQSPQASLSLWCKTACKTVSVVGFCSSIAASGTSWTTLFSSKTCFFFFFFFFLLTCQRVEKSGLAGAWRTHDRKHATRLCVSRQSMEHCLILALSIGDGHPQVWPRQSCAGAVVVSSCC